MEERPLAGEVRRGGTYIREGDRSRRKGEESVERGGDGGGGGKKRNDETV